MSLYLNHLSTENNIPTQNEESDNSSITNKKSHSNWVIFFLIVNIAITGIYFLLSVLIKNDIITNFEKMEIMLVFFLFIFILLIFVIGISLQLVYLFYDNNSNTLWIFSIIFFILSIGIILIISIVITIRYWAKKKHGFR